MSKQQKKKPLGKNKVKWKVLWKHHWYLAVVLLIVGVIVAHFHVVYPVQTAFGLPSHRWAADGAQIGLDKGGTIRYMTDADVLNAKPGMTCYQLIDYNYLLTWQDTADIPLVLCKASIGEVRDVERKDETTDVPLYESIVEITIEDVVFNPTDIQLKQGDSVTVYSYNATAADDGYPVLKTGECYYLTLQSTALTFPESRDRYLEFSSFARNTAQFTVSKLHYAKWPVIDDLVYAPAGVLPVEDEEDFTMIGAQRYYAYPEKIFKAMITNTFQPMEVLWTDVEIQGWQPPQDDPVTE